MGESHPFSGSIWLWPTRAHSIHNSYTQLRRDFSLDAPVRRAEFFITADQSYMLFVNGKHVGRGPARGYQSSWPYDQYDLAGHLRVGHNWISIRAYNAGVGTYGYIHQSAAGVIAAGRIGGVDVGTASGYLMRLDPSHRVDVARTSWQTNFQEHVDLGLDDQSWISSARPPRPGDAGWATAGGGKAFGTMPWHALEPRGLPALTRNVIPYRRVVCAADGPCDKDHASVSNLGDALAAELGSLAWRAEQQGRVGGERFDLTLPPCRKGRLHAAVLDLGQPSVGTLIVRGLGGRAGDCLDFYFTEIADAGGPLLTRPDTGCGAAMALRLKLPGGKFSFEAHHLMGHRHLVVVSRQTAGPLKLSLSLRESIYPLEVRGRLETSDATLNDIYRICVRTQRVCSLDGYVDTPWREQAQWWGDARVQARNTFFLSDDRRLLERGIRNIAAQEVPNGLTYGHAPTTAHHCVLPDFSLIWLLTIWDAYWQSGDTEVFIRQWPRIRRLLAYFGGEARHATGLLRADERYWLFLDWSDVQKDGVPAMLNLWYAIALKALAQMAEAAGMPSEARQLRRQDSQQRRLISRHLWDQKARLFRDGLDAAGRPAAGHCIQAQTLGIMAGLEPRWHGHMIQQRLLPYARGLEIPGPLPSSYWVTYVYEVLLRQGFAREVVGHIRPLWAKMVPHGGAWELFQNVFGHNSVTHAWSAHPIYHLTEALGGIRQAAPAWSSIRFEPLLDDPAVEHAAADVPTPQGVIRSRWRRGKSIVDVSLELPAGVQADVHLPGVQTSTASRRNRWKIVI